MSESPHFSVEIDGRVLNGWLWGADAGSVLLFQPGTPAPPVRWDSLELLASSTSQPVRVTKGSMTIGVTIA